MTENKMTNIHDIENALQASIVSYIEKIGIEEFKKTSFFISTHLKEAQLEKAARKARKQNRKK